jgi:hypothetical protein
MGLLYKAMMIRRLNRLIALDRLIKMGRRKRMKIIYIDNISLIEHADNKMLLSGRRAVLIPRFAKPIPGPSYISHIQIQGVEYKYCPHCKTWKNMASYCKNKGTADGYKDKCKSCDNKIRRIKYAQSKGVS